MKTQSIPRWYITPHKEATHLINDHILVYWVVMPDMTNEQVAKAYRTDRSGTGGIFHVTDLRTGLRDSF